MQFSSYACRQTNNHTHHNTLQPYWGKVIIITVSLELASLYRCYKNIPIAWTSSTSLHLCTEKCSMEEFTILHKSIFLQLSMYKGRQLTFNNLALRVCLTGFDDVIGCRVQLKAVRFTAVTCHLTHLNILQRNYTLRLFVLRPHVTETTTDTC